MLYLLDEKNKVEEISFDLETVLIKEMIDYKLYHFANKFDQGGEGLDDEVLLAVLNALKIPLAKYLNIYGDDLELYLNQRIFGLIQFGYKPPVYVSAVIVDLFVFDLYETLSECG